MSKISNGAHKAHRRPPQIVTINPETFGINPINHQPTTINRITTPPGACPFSTDGKDDSTTTPERKLNVDVF